MLPFRLNKITYDSIAETKAQINKDPYLNASLDFYSGILIAIDSLQSLGVSLKVDVYDTKYQVSEVSKIINDHDFEDVDAVIGPLTPNNFDVASSELRKYNVPVISPIGENLKLNENVFQTRPSAELLKNKIVSYIRTIPDIKNIIIISDSKNVNVANELKQDFPYAIQIRSRKNKDGNDQNYILVDDVNSILKEGLNVVFLETQNKDLPQM